MHKQRLRAVRAGRIVLGRLSIAGPLPHPSRRVRAYLQPIPLKSPAPPKPGAAGRQRPAFSLGKARSAGYQPRLTILGQCELRHILAHFRGPYNSGVVDRGL